MRNNFWVIMLLVSGLCWTTWARADNALESTALRLYQTAKQLESKGEYSNAIDLLKQAFKIVPNKYIQFHLVKDYFKAGDCTNAQKEIAKIDESAFDRDERPAVHAALVNILVTCNVNVPFKTKGVDAAASWVVAFQASETDKQRNMVRSKVLGYISQKQISRWMIKAFLKNKTRDVGRFWSMVSAILGPDKTNVYRLKHLLVVVRNLVGRGRVKKTLDALKRVEKIISTNEALKPAKRAEFQGISCDTPSKAAVCALLRFAKQDYMAGHYDMASREFALIVRLYDAPILRFYFALALLWNGQADTAKKVLWKTQQFIFPALPHHISAAVLQFKQKKPEDVKNLGKLLQKCEAGYTRFCEQGLSKLAKQGKITACQVEDYFKGSPELRRYFAVDCTAEKAVSGGIRSHAVSGGRVIKAAVKPSGRKTLRPYAWTTAGVSGAALVTGAILLGIAESSLKDLSNNWQKKYQVDAKAQQDAAYTKRRWGWALVGVGAAAGVASVLLFVLEPKHVKIAPAVTQGMQGVNVRMEF